MRKKTRLASPGALIAILMLFFAFSSPVFSQNKADKIDGLLKLYYDYGKFNGTALVAEGGRVIYKKGFGLANMEWNIPNRPDTKFRLGSITKQFTSMLILQLVEEGKIRLDGKLSEYLPYYREDTGKKVTIHHLLTHSSGIPSYTNLPNFMDEVSRDPYGVEEFVKKYCSGDLEFEPGARFNYNNSGYFILGAVIEKITGQPYEKVLEEKIFKPLGMKNSGYDRTGPIIADRAAGYEQSLEGYTNAPYLDMSLPYAAGSLYSTVEDLFFWDQALYTDKLLSAKMKELLFRPHVPMGGAAYGYGWGVGKKILPQSKREVALISHSGGINGFNTLIERYVDDKQLIVLLNNTGGTSLREMSTSICRILYDEPFDPPKKSIARTLIETMRKKDLDTAIRQYHELKKTRPSEFDLRPVELNGLGYALFGEDRFDDAIKIFLLNIEAYPQDANGYDSLAEAYAAKGDKTLAIKNYAKSLELDPDNTNAIERLNRLIKEK
ncbi:MAG: serine hydrolase [Candidatus Aminicenantes bacterium]|nr:serine hydrolase [Candidatus Aminicenantes bacterium]